MRPAPCGPTGVQNRLWPPHQILPSSALLFGRRPSRRGTVEAPSRQPLVTPKMHPKFDLNVHLHFFRLFGIFETKTLPKWSQNRLPNQIFGFFFAIFFSTAFLDRFCLHRFLEAPTLKNINFTKGKQGVSLNRRFQKSLKKRCHFEPILVTKITKQR